MTITQTHHAKQSHMLDRKQWGDDSKPCCNREQMVVKHERGKYEIDATIRICCGQTQCHQKKDAISSNPQQPEHETVKMPFFTPPPSRINNRHIQSTTTWAFWEKRGGESSEKTTINKAARKSTAPWAARKRKRRWLTESAAISGDEFFCSIWRIYEPNHNFCFMTFACNLKVILCKFPT